MQKIISGYIIEDEEAQHKVKMPSGRMYYHFWTASNDMELLFLTIFAISFSNNPMVVCYCYMVTNL